ncbi:MAG: deoxyribonuclease IV [Planctomycetota bacterium]|nr:deoxyribonuclease IV [Planctomycetota bacterium]
MRFGMHLAFSNGPRRAREIGCRSLQVFCGNPRGWHKTPLEPAFVERFRADAAAAGLEPVVVHATYLINMAAPDARLYERSRKALVTELERAVQIGAHYYVIHCGHHMGSGAAAGRKRVATCLREALNRVPHGPPILLENAGGSGTELGATFEALAEMLDAAGSPRLGVCLDTCHTLIAGYEIRTPEGVAATLDHLARTVGLERLRCLHVNDAKGNLGSHLDRHEHVGRGHIGAHGFRAFFADRRLWHLPAILETPKDAPCADPDNLWRAIGIAIAAGATSVAESGRRPRRIRPDVVPARRRTKAKPLAKKKSGGKMRAARRKQRRSP